MSNLFPIILGVLLIIFIMRMLPVKGVKNIIAADINSMSADKNKQFIDVRTKGEYNQYHIPAFVNFPLHQLKNDLSKLDPEKETVIICQSGMRSNRAVRILKKAGFQNLIHIKNGVSGYRPN